MVDRRKKPDGSVVLSSSPPIGDAFSTYRQGGWPATPDATTGVAVTITKAGYYLLSMSATGFTTGLSAQTMNFVVDGVAVIIGRYFFNAVSDHRTFPTVWAVVQLSAGTHYLCPGYSGGSDSQDWAFFSGIWVKN